VRTLLAILVLSYAPFAAAANHYGHGVPFTIGVQGDGTVYVVFDPASQVTGTPPACTGWTSGGITMQFDSKTLGGQSMLATLLTAHANGDAFWYFGSGDCAAYGNKESLTQVAVN